MARIRQTISGSTGASENSIVFFPSGGHSHNGQNSSLIDTTVYSVYDFSPTFVGTDVNSDRAIRQESNRIAFEDLIKRIVNLSILEPAGIRLEPGSLNGNVINANTITSNEIAANTITATELVSNIILVNNVISSSNYSSGVSGWQISNTGSAEFNNVTVRGTIVSSNGTIGGFTLSSNTLSAGSGSDQITISTGIYNAVSNPDEIVIGIGGPLSNGFSLPFAINSSGTLSAQVATIGPLQLDATGFTSEYANATNYFKLYDYGDILIRSRPYSGTHSGLYHQTDLVGEYFQVKRTNSSWVGTNSRAFLGYWDSSDNPQIVLFNSSGAVGFQAYANGSVTGTTFYGNLSGNATTATTASSAATATTATTASTANSVSWANVSSKPAVVVSGDTGVNIGISTSNGISGGSLSTTGGGNINADGDFYRTTTSNVTTSTNAYYVVWGNNTNGGFLRRYSSSSLKYKTDIKEIDLSINDSWNPLKILDINTYTYKYKDGYLAEGDSGIGKTFLGFLAEDVYNKYPAASVLDEDGHPETWNVMLLVPAMLTLIKDLYKKIEILESK